MIIWICGISGSGKSTIAGEVALQLRGVGRSTAIVDGDVIRTLSSPETPADAYTLTGRRRNAETVDKVVHWLDDQEIDVVVAVQSIFQDILDRHRATLRGYFEVHLDASMALVQQRDPKGLHARALADGGIEVVGYGIPYHRAQSSDLYIDMDADRRSPSDMALQICEQALKTGVPCD